MNRKKTKTSQDSHQFTAFPEIFPCKAWYTFLKPLLILVLLTTAFTASSDINQGLVAYYPFNGNANDASGNGNNGTVNGLYLTNDIYGNNNSAYQFDGSTGYIKIPRSTTLSFIDNFTFSLWFNHSMLKEQVLISKSGDTTGIGIKCHDSGGIGIENGRCCPVHSFDAGAVNAFEWHMITVSQGNGMIKAYLDGVFQNSETTADFNLNPAMANEPVYVGMGPFNWYFYKGVIDEVRIYNRVLSAAEIQQLYSLVTDGNVGVSNVRANQSPGTTLVDLFYDLSGTGLGYSVSIAVSSDGGSSFTVPATHFTGDGVMGPAAPGAGRHIVWDAGADCPGQFSTTMRVKVVVGSAFALSPMFTLDTCQVTTLNITRQPVDASVVPGASVALSVAATGSPLLCYQWWKDNTLLPGATTPTLNFSSAQLSDSGNYRVVISNDYHVVFSDMARLTVIADPANNSQPKLPSAPPPVPKADIHDSLVIVTHGWQPWCWPPRDLCLPPSDVPWVDETAKAIRERVSSNWRVDSFKWISDAWTQLPDEALNKARSIGYRRGRELAAQQWKHVHLIGHSAGAGFVQAAAEAIKGFSPSTVVHTTFLDPYSGEDLWGRDVYGFAADWADCYFAHDMKTDEFPALFWYSPSTTEGVLSHAHNVDVTWLDPGAIQLFFDCQGRPQSDPATACRQEAWSSHDWPYRFYAATVSGNPASGSAGYGFPLSKEGDGWGNHSTYPNNTTPVVLSGTPSLTQRLLPWLASLPIKSIDQINHVVSDARSVLINRAGFLMSSLPTSPQPQAMDFAMPYTQVKSTGTNDPVGVPAWLSIGLTVTNAVNFVTFEASFTSSRAARGLLTVYWNTNQIGFLDEELVQPRLQTYRFRLTSTVADGLHVLGFRLDSFNNMASTVAVTNVATGFIGITEPLVLDVSRPVANGPALITLTGAPGYNYLMHRSTDLTTWVPLATLVNTNGTVLFADPAVTNSSQRFYRAVLP